MREEQPEDGPEVLEGAAGRGREAAGGLPHQGHELVHVEVAAAVQVDARHQLVYVVFGQNVLSVSRRNGVLIISHRITMWCTHH